MTIPQVLQAVAISFCFSQLAGAETTDAEAIALNNQAVKSIHADHLDEAEKTLLQALNHWGTRQSPEAAAAHNNLAQVYKLQNQFAKADAHYRKAIDLWEQIQGPRSVSLAKGLMNLSDLYRVQGKVSGAVKLLERAMAIFEEGSKDSLDARNRLAEAYVALGRTTEARRLQRGPASNSLLQSDSH